MPAEQASFLIGGEESEAHHPFDTNAEILPSKRTKAPAVPGSATESKPEKLSKKKRRKLEQLAKKRESQELRAEVLKELKSVQLTQEQASLLKASQSTNSTRRQKLEVARQRVALGVPLTRDLKKLRRRRPTAAGDEEGAEESDDDGDAAGSRSHMAKDLLLSATTMRPGGAVRAEPPGPSSKGVRALSLQFGLEAVGATDGGGASKLPRCSADALAAPLAQSAAQASAVLLPVNKVAAPPSAHVAPAAPAQTPKHPPRLEDSDEDRATAPGRPELARQPLVRERVCRREDIEEQRSKLPAVMMEQELIEMTASTDVLLVCGETGCGKSTQVPQFLFEAGYCQGGSHLIAVTQPRRVAAISVSQRVESELNMPGTVGYQVRYDKSHCSRDTRIKFMTDGILLREVQSDFLCRKYAVIIIDEAHERGVNCDILIGLLSRAVQCRRRDFEAAVRAGRCSADGSSGPASVAPPLKLVIMSATLRLCDFTENNMLFKFPPPVLRIEARTFPVTAHFSRRTEDDYIKAAKRSVLQIHTQLPPGSILVFVTGREEVHRLCRLLNANRTLARRHTDEATDVNADGGADEDDAEAQPQHQLEESDNEDSEDFDDDLTPEAPDAAPAVSEADGGPKVPKARAKARGRKRGAAAKAAGAAGEAAVAKATVEQAPGGSDVADVDEPESGAAPANKKKRRKGAKGAMEQPGAQAGAAGDEGDAAKVADDECNVDFRIDAEEDVVLLDPDAENASAAEDAKDIEARRQKRIRMAKLDKSRTAGGAFKGCGFGEGPVRALPLYAQLSARAQLAPFAAPPDGERIVVVATNVAETSVTLPNVRYVVDTGHEKRKKYKQSSGVSSFAIERISKASADQRAGRAGRLGPGHAYRLYSAAAYENHFTPFAPIPILHTPMDPVVLLIAFLGVPRLDVFPWPTPPSPESVVAALHRLKALGAIADDSPVAARAIGATVKCTRLGLRLAALPVAPRYGKILLDAVAATEDTGENIIEHACAIVAALSVGNLSAWESFRSPLDDQEEVTAGENELVRAQRDAHRRLLDAQKQDVPRWSQLRDDAEGLLWLMGGYSWAAQSGQEAVDSFCQANRLNPRQVSEAHSLMQQLGELLKRRLSLEATGTTLALPIRVQPPTAAQALKLRECVLQGLIDHVAVNCPDQGSNAYICADLGPERPIFVHNSSNLYRRRPRPSMLVFNEIISTTRPCMRECISVDPLVLARLASKGECPLLQLGEFLPVPAPRYLRDQDRVMAFCSPSYMPLQHKLPTIEIDVPTDSIFRYKVFARALLEGEVISALPPRGVRLLAIPSIVLHAPTNPRVQAVVQVLWAARVGSRAELLKKWKADSRFLLEGVLKWLPASAHEDVSISWPPVGDTGKR